MEYEYLQSLNEEQRASVVHTGSPLLILAGAGSGKTRVITNKIAYLIENEHIDPYRILAVTFTKKAAQEMQERAMKIDPLCSEAMIRTFHSFGSWFLRRYASLANISPSFNIYDEDDVASLITKSFPTLKKKDASQYAKKIALCKDYCLTSQDDLSSLDVDEKFYTIYKAYEDRLRETGNVDFGDLILKPYLILQENPELRKEMYKRFKVIMVDEYQDSNVAQFKLLEVLSGLNENSGTYVCVVGDDDQSIYAFRGADVQNIIRFPELFPNTKIIRLQKNYRSRGAILKTANNVVRNNASRLGKVLEPVRPEGKLPILAFLDNQDAEASFVSEVIEKKIHSEKHPCKYSDFAVLYRTNAQSVCFEKEFLHKKIPYKVVGSLKFYEREEVKDLLAYLAFIINGRDEVALDRIINKPVRGIGPKTFEKIIAFARMTNSGSSDALPIDELIKYEALNFSKAYGNSLKEFCEMTIKYRERLITSSSEESDSSDFDANGRLSVFVNELIEESGLKEYFKELDEKEDTSRVNNMYELSNSAFNYPATLLGLLDFLDAINLDRTLSDTQEVSQDAVTLITLHNTKGLEYKNVFITGLENKIFPREDKFGKDLEEERRLCYVGITRARDNLFLTSCRTRRLYGRFELMSPSKFINEMGDSLKVIGRAPYGYQTTASNVSLRPKDPLLTKYSLGKKIHHYDYGEGEIVKQNTKGSELIIEVLFQDGVKRKFLPRIQGKVLDIVE